MKPTLSEWRGVGGVLPVQKNPWTVKKFIAQSKDTKPVIFAESFVDDSLGKIILFFYFI